MEPKKDERKKYERKKDEQKTSELATKKRRRLSRRPPKRPSEKDIESPKEEILKEVSEYYKFDQSTDFNKNSKSFDECVLPIKRLINGESFEYNKEEVLKDLKPINIDINIKLENEKTLVYSAIEAIAKNLEDLEEFKNENDVFDTKGADIKITQSKINLNKEAIELLIASDADIYANSSLKTNSENIMESVLDFIVDIENNNNAKLILRCIDTSSIKEAQKLNTHSFIFDSPHTSQRGALSYPYFKNAIKKKSCGTAKTLLEKGLVFLNSDTIDLINKEKNNNSDNKILEEISQIILFKKKIKDEKYKKDKKISDIFEYKKDKEILDIVPFLDFQYTLEFLYKEINQAQKDHKEDKIVDIEEILKTFVSKKAEIECLKKEREGRSEEQLALEFIDKKLQVAKGLSQEKYKTILNDLKKSFKVETIQKDNEKSQCGEMCTCM